MKLLTSFPEIGFFIIFSYVSLYSEAQEYYVQGTRPVYILPAAGGETRGNDFDLVSNARYGVSEEDDVSQERGFSNTAKQFSARIGLGSSEDSEEIADSDAAEIEVR